MKNPARKKEVEDRAGGDGGSWVEGGWGGGGVVSSNTSFISNEVWKLHKHRHWQHTPKNTALLFSPLHFHPVWCLSVSHLHICTSRPSCPSHTCCSHEQDVTAESKCKLYLADAAQFQNELHGCSVEEREREKKRLANKGGDHSVCLICQRHRRRAVKTTSECLGCEPS